MIGGKKLSKIFKFNNENVFVHYHYKINAQILLVKVSLSNMQQIMENLCPSSSRIYAWKKNCLQYCYNLKRAQSGPIKSVWTRPGDKDNRDLEPSAARDDAATSQWADKVWTRRMSSATTLVQDLPTFYWIL